jgi:cellulose synthase/poly-beta-1,6-N-acetylglucosamine synthase-like glycosyltransferase
MIFIEIIFWISALILFYTYFGYPILMTILSKISFVKYLIRMPEGFGRVLLNPKIGGYYASTDIAVKTNFEPYVSMIIAAYNEEDFLEQKIKNCRELDYPKDKIEFVFVTDGSTDNSNKILDRHKNENLYYFYLPKRNGKLHAIKRVISFVSGEIIIFSDANAFYNKKSIRKLVRHFAHSKVGCVSGEKRVAKADGSLPAEGLYWRYESFIKKLDSELYSVVGAPGEIFAIRKNLFIEIPENSIIEDFTLSLEIARRGFRVIYESEAFSMENPPLSFVDEFKRRVRLSRGGIQSIGFFKDLLKFKERKFLSFQFVSHRLFRWVIAPACLVIIFTTNFILKLIEVSSVYDTLFYAQLIFYSAALIGLLLEILKVKILGINLIFSFMLMNFAALVALLTYPFSVLSNIWEKTQRESAF